MISSQLPKCFYCQKPATKVCYDQKCYKDPFLCESECMNGKYVSRDIHDHNNKGQLTSVSIECLDNIIQNINKNQLDDYKKQIISKMNSVIMKLQSTIEKYFKVLDQKCQLKVSAIGLKTVQSLKKLSQHQTIYGTNIGCLLYKKRLYENYQSTTILFQQLKENLNMSLMQITNNITTIDQNILKIITKKSKCRVDIQSKTQHVDTQNYYAIAKKAFQNKDYKKALQYAKKCQKSDPENHEIYYLIGQCNQFGERKWRAAYNNYQTSTKKNPHFAEGYYRMGRVYQIPQKYKQSIKYFEKALQIEQNPEYYYYKGISERKCKEYANAISSFSQANQFEENPKYLCQLGICFSQNGNNEQGIKYLTKCIEMSAVPNHQYFKTRGIMYSLIGQKIKSDEDFRIQKDLNARKNKSSCVNEKQYVKKQASEISTKQIFI